MTLAPSRAAPDSPVLVWFRDDLRLDDNPALSAACAEGRPVCALYILDDAAAGDWALGGAARWWLHHALASLKDGLAALGIPLVLRRGDTKAALTDIAASSGAASIHWNRRYLPWAKDLDTALKAELRAAGLTVTSHNGALLREPWEVATGSGGPYKVFSPYWRASRAMGAPSAPVPAPTKATGLATPPPSDALDSWALLPTRPDWAGGLRAAWTPGEAAARALLERFIDKALRGYGEARNRPGITGTSRLSPHIRFGEISIRRIWSVVASALVRDPALEADADVFFSELGWREFSFGLLHHFPDFPDQSWKRDFDRFPWASAPDHLKAWQKGQTGYPIVDAGMRELWATGWMHNRVRMIVGSFLVKHLLIDWREGERWFWDTLVDADLANNSAGWQWIAGCGADAAPYFRVFNPVSQGEKFDADGAYVRRWVPEIARLPNALIHKPWEAPPLVLRQTGITLGSTYPRPIVDHAKARERALAAFATLKNAA